MIKKTKKIKNVLLSLAWYEARIHSGLLDFSKGKGWYIYADPHFVEQFGNCSFDGAILSPDEGGKRLQWIKSLDIPFVTLFDDPTGSEAPCICIDQKAVGDMAADFFARRKFRNFATLYPHTHPPNQRFQMRMEGFSEHVRSVKGSLFVRLRKPEPETLSREKDNYAKIAFFKRNLQALPKPLAVFILEDSAAIYLQLACIEMGLSIPEDVAIIAVNDDPTICPFTPVPLSSIDLGLSRLGSMAGSILERMMAGDKVSNEKITLLPLAVVERLSSSIIAVDDPRVSKAVSYIWQNLENDPRVEDVCDAAGVDQRTLIRAFKRHLGRGIKEEIQDARIRKIKELLLGSKMNSSKIADRMNFSSLYYFYKFFKRHAGMSTKEFRKTAEAGLDMIGHL